MLLHLDLLDGLFIVDKLLNQEVNKSISHQQGSGGLCQAQPCHSVLLRGWPSTTLALDYASMAVMPEALNVLIS